MSERYNVAASAVLGENYKITSIECSDYNPSIDGNITVTITVNDVYGDAISGESVTVTASEGNFTQLNGSDITAASSVTGTTNSSGQFTLTYNCSEWGLITFTANNTSTQVNVTGWKRIGSYASNKITLDSDGKWGKVSIGGSFSGSTTGENVLATIDSNYTPVSNVSTNFSYSNPDYRPVYLKGNQLCYSRGASGNVGIYCTLYFTLATPRY